MGTQVRLTTTFKASTFLAFAASSEELDESESSEEFDSVPIVSEVQKRESMAGLRRHTNRQTDKQKE
jgi:hypothetical protein